MHGIGPSLWDPGDSAGHPKLPNGRAGDEWASSAPGIKKGLAMMCTKTSNYFCFTLNFCLVHKNPFKPYFFIIISLTPQIISTILTNFPIFANSNHNSPKLLFSAPPNIVGSHYMTIKPRCIRNEWAAYWNHCINGSTKLGCTTHIIWHLWHVMKVQYIDIQR